jgi:4-hydroxybenzoate polyprenyltransferase
MKKIISLYRRLNSFVTYNIFLYANFSLLFAISFGLEFLVSQIYILIVAYFFIGIAGYFINDFFDVADDRISGKFNITSLISKKWVLVLIFSCVVIGLNLVKLLSKNIVYTILIEILFLLAYSVKPLRLKEKGFLGVLADSFYAHIIPSIILVQFISQYVSVSYWLWFNFIALNFFIGVRDILLHQLADFEKDLKSTTETFYVKNANLSNQLIFWIEEVVSILLILLLFILFLNTNTFDIFLAFLLVFLYWLNKFYFKVIEINHVVKFYILVSTIFLLVNSSNLLAILFLLLHPYNFQLGMHFIGKFWSNVFSLTNKFYSILHHIYKSKITLFVNYFLYYLFLLFGRNLKKKPLYKKKENKY